MNRKKQLLDLILAKISKLSSQELKQVRDFVVNIENKKSLLDMHREELKKIKFSIQEVNHIISYDMIKEDGKNYILLCLDPAEIKYLNERYKDITIDIEQAIKQLILSSKYEYKKRGERINE